MNVALIPVSRKNKFINLEKAKPVNSDPFIYWSLRAACESKNIDKVYVSVDSDDDRERVDKLIKGEQIPNSSKIEVINKISADSENAHSIEAEMISFANVYKFKFIALINEVAPTLGVTHIDSGFEAINKGKDSALTVVRQKRLVWKDVAYEAGSVNDALNVLREDETDGILVENNALYITSNEKLLSSQKRVSGKIGFIEMPDESNLETLNRLFDNRNEGREIPRIKMLLTDCDGCLTDGGMYYSENGDELKKFNTSDGVALLMLKDMGIITGMVTGEDKVLNRRRAEKLKLDVYEGGCKNKLDYIHTLLEQYNIELENIAFIGDEMNDFEVMSSVGLAFAPQNAVSEIKKISDFICEKSGGSGVVREVLSHLINLNCLSE